MARYTGAVCRICRRHGEKLFLKGEKCFTKCTLDRRGTLPPGQRSSRRRKVSDRALQLREKQKARYAYGVLERQFRRYYEEAVRRTGVTGENLIRALELRLDNVVYRLGFGDSRSQARQLVRHGHITVNGRSANIPSYRLRVDDELGWSARGQRSEYFAIQREQMRGKTAPSWLSLNEGAMTGRVLALPSVAEAAAQFNPAVIVEYYSR